jgi:hypothetical protein
LFSLFPWLAEPNLKKSSSQTRLPRIWLWWERVGALVGDPSLGRLRRLAPVASRCGSTSERMKYNGKVTGLIYYDCFGDFGGFLLDDCGQPNSYSRLHRIEELVHIAWREWIAITVVTSAAHPRRPLSLILRAGPGAVSGLT